MVSDAYQIKPLAHFCTSLYQADSLPFSKQVDSDDRPTIRRRSLELALSRDSDSGDDRRHSWTGQSDSTKPRKRPVKARADTESASPTSLSSDHEIGSAEDKHNVQLNRQARKASAGSSTRNSIPSRRHSSSESGSEKEATGFFSRLGRILEGSESENERRKRPMSKRKTRSSQVSLVADDRSSALRRPARSRATALDKRSEGLSDLLNANQSMLSVVSGLTSASGTSSGSNSTVTQKSYEKAITKRKRTKDRKPKRPQESAKRVTASKPAASHTEPTSDVFQYLQAPSVTSNMDLSRDVDSDSDSGRSSPDLGEQVATPMPAPVLDHQAYSSPPPSVHLADETDSDTHTDRLHSDSGISVRSASPDAASKGAPIDVNVDDEQDDTHPDPAEHAVQLHTSQQMAVPHAPRSRDSTRSRSPFDDHHLQRMRNQEDDLRRHVSQHTQPRVTHTDAGPALMPPHMPPDPSPLQYIDAAPLYHPQPALPHQHAAVPQYSQASLPPPMPQYAHAPMPPSIPPYPPRLAIDNNRTTITGYELVAHKLANTEMSDSDSDSDNQPQLTPVYRKFEHLNHRVLLHLQDEIAELEEELRYIDEQCAQFAPTDEEGAIVPSSRRGDARFGGELHYRRTELLGRVYMKLGQYNKALISYSKVNTISRATPTDVATFANWLDTHAPIESLETDFLDRDGDLLRLPRKSSTPPPATSATSATPVVECKPAAPSPPTEIVKPATAARDTSIPTPHPAFLFLPLAFVVPLLAFALIDGFLARLIALTVIALGEAALVLHTNLVELLGERKWIMAAGVYFGVMAVLAGLAR